jgi:hypothetical protein
VCTLRRFIPDLQRGNAWRSGSAAKPLWFDGRSVDILVQSAGAIEAGVERTRAGAAASALVQCGLSRF